MSKFELTNYIIAINKYYVIISNEKQALILREWEKNPYVCIML